MKKVELIKQLEEAKSLTSTVDIDKMITLINGLELTTKSGITEELAQEIAGRIERTLDYHASDLVDKDDITFNINYGNTIELDEAQIDVADVMNHITACLDEFIVDEDEDDERNDGFVTTSAVIE